MSIYSRMAELALRRPWTIPSILRAAWAFRDRRWYRRFPFLPMPPSSYLRWRMETALGDPEAVPDLDDLERYLAWSARMRRRISGRREMERPAHD
ncbi:MAG: hypothetical protein U5R14_11285 [Gemmatimonadota bacterium]|nr:hypothetical protein [Gemmatimonadota bacterium]